MFYLFLKTELLNNCVIILVHSWLAISHSRLKRTKFKNPWDISCITLNVTGTPTLSSRLQSSTQSSNNGSKWDPYKTLLVTSHIKSKICLTIIDIGGNLERTSSVANKGDMNGSSGILAYRTLASGEGFSLELRINSSKLLWTISKRKIIISSVSSDICSYLVRFC